MWASPALSGLNIMASDNLFPKFRPPLTADNFFEERPQSKGRGQFMGHLQTYRGESAKNYGNINNIGGT